MRKIDLIVEHEHHSRNMGHNFKKKRLID